jgi:hypothetical protein
MTAMTDLLTRPSRTTTASRAPTRFGSSTTIAAIGAGGVAAGAGLLVIGVVVITTWAASLHGGASAGDALRAVAYVWLLAHRVTLSIDGSHVALLPIGLLALPAYALLRAGRWFAEAADINDIRSTLTGGLVLGGAYGFVTAVVASASATRTTHPAAGQALLAGCCVGMLFGTTGIARGAGLIQPIWAALPQRARSMAAAAGAGLAVLLGAGALLAIGGLLLHAGRVTHLGGELGPGPVGGVALVLACVAYVPNAVLWSTAYAVGPGFAVGAHTSVSPLGVHLGAVPAFPLLGALPDSGSAPASSLPFVVMPLVAGAVIGVLLIRRLPALRMEDAAFAGFATGALTGAVLGLLTALSGGPAGPGRMATVGPSAWQVGLMAALELGVGAAIGAAEMQRRLLRS